MAGIFGAIGEDFFWAAGADKIVGVITFVLMRASGEIEIAFTGWIIAVIVLSEIADGGWWVIYWFHVARHVADTAGDGVVKFGVDIGAKSIEDGKVFKTIRAEDDAFGFDGIF